MNPSAVPVSDFSPLLLSKKKCKYFWRLFKIILYIFRAAARPAPDALTKRLDALGVPSNPITVYKEENTRLSRLKRGLSQEDQQIAERLRKLQK